jgi:nitrile hydratase
MNGVHDMGGMQDFGPVVPEIDEPVFHYEWERRAFALTLAMGATGAWNLDQSRAARESLPPAQYLASSYYRIWLEGLQALLLERGLVTAEELADGRVHETPRPVSRVLTADAVAPSLARGASPQRTLDSAPRFRVGDAVRTRDLHPATHTRLPRYCRGKPGTVAATHGAHLFADAHALGVDEPLQWLYTVRFDAHALWGADTTAATVCVDCWEPYLDAG